MDVAEARRRSDANLAATLRMYSGMADGGQWQEQDGVLLFAGGHAYPGAYTNGVLRIGDDLSAPEALARARDFFAPRRHGYAVWIRADEDTELEAAARGEGMFPRPPETGMAGMVRGEPLEPPQLPPRTRIVPVETPAAARDFLTVLTIAYGIDGVGPELAAGIFFDPRCLLEPDVLAVLAVVDGEPVATTMATLVDGTVGLYWTATVPQARGGGVAQACFTTVANTGFERGADLATLQASAMGEPLWRRLGFREVRRYRRYLAKPPA